MFKGKYNMETYFSKFLHYNWWHPSMIGAKKKCFPWIPEWEKMVLSDSETNETLYQKKGKEKKGHA